ncbi:MAG TPA: hypothetical protein VFD75_03350 [Pyrinomonadaceae bacterium]|nr:hypothetical protein [Pyrinomonadaceae bacterium]
MPSFLPPFWTEKPTEIRVYPCPACHETISVAAASCRFCHLPIEPKLAEQLLLENHRVTNAVVHAKTFGLSKTVAVVVTGYSLWSLFMEGRLTVSMVGVPIIALAYGTHWLYRNGSLVTHDADYPAAIATVKRTMVVWVAVLLVQLGIYFFLNGIA